MINENENNRIESKIFENCPYLNNSTKIGRCSSYRMTGKDEHYRLCDVEIDKKYSCSVCDRKTWSVSIFFCAYLDLINSFICGICYCLAGVNYFSERKRIDEEKDLIEKYNLQEIDVLKVGHHGSKTSSSKNFIDEIEPKYSII